MIDRKEEKIVIRKIKSRVYRFVLVEIMNQKNNEFIFKKTSTFTGIDILDLGRGRWEWASFYCFYNF